MEMTTVSPAQVFAELFRVRNRRGTDSKLNPQQVAERLGTHDVSTVKGCMDTVFFADLLHMAHFRAEPTDAGYTWHYGVTRRARRMVKAIGVEGVTEEIIASEYHDAMAWRPRKRWDVPVG